MAPKYQVLARKYRPQRFTEVVGQEAILKTLRNALKRDAIAHAYLFCGSRGVGKTTLARLFAKSLNCAAPADGEPCNQCPSCVEITSGQSLDVIEIDGASNRGIDDIRQINETVGFAPSHGKYKIYIIDEVHMLTKEAFNALLKTLEEPPEQVKFFFATTEPHKVLPTIISRCQRFDLGRLLPTQISDKLASIAKDLNRNVDAEALHLLAHFADGSLRDAESLFDQILCFSGETVTAADVQNALGLAPKELFFSFDAAYAEHRLAHAFELTAQLFDAGKDLSHFLDQLIEHYRHLTVAKTLGEKGLHLPPELAARYTASARLYTQPHCLSILDLLIKAEAQLAKSASPRITLELTLLQILRLKNRLPIEVLVHRLTDLEEKLSSQQPLQPRSEPLVPVQIPQVPEVLIAPPAPLEVKQPLPTLETPSTLEPVPFNPFKPIETPPAPQYVAPKPVELPPTPQAEKKPISTPLLPPKLGVEKKEMKPPAPTTPSLGRRPADYDTIIRFAAVELEGTIKK
jgi:DNA polymerase-3 subunit gamma/tau